MRRYQDPVEVRRGYVAGDGDDRVGGAGMEGPEQFLWRGRLWKVRAVLAHWVETGPWWQSASVQAVLGDDPAGPAELRPLGELLTERELWRVEAGRGGPAVVADPDEPGGAPDGAPDGGGVFDLCFDWADGCWQLVGCHD